MLVAVGPRQYTEEAVREMALAYEPYYARGERYALLSVQPKDAVMPGAKERKLITDWTNSKRVRTYSKKLCVGSASVITNPLARGALTALLWVWTPPIEVNPVASVDEGIDYCLAQLERANVPLPRTASLLRREVHRLLKDVM